MFEVLGGLVERKGTIDKNEIEEGERPNRLYLVYIDQKNGSHYGEAVSI